MNAVEIITKLDGEIIGINDKNSNSLTRNTSRLLFFNVNYFKNKPKNKSSFFEIIFFVYKKIRIEFIDSQLQPNINSTKLFFLLLCDVKI
jgi:hypothetical protein